MRKTLIFVLLSLSLLASAQHPFDGKFETTWVDCVPWQSNGNTQAFGTEPTGWCVSNVPNSSMPKVASSVDGYTGKAVKLENVAVMGQTAPGYITLGTTWATAEVNGIKLSVRNADGGTFGGIAFASHPDALSLKYKRDANNGTEKATILAYIWSGSWSQSNVPGNTAIGVFSFGTATKCTMIDRDYNVLGKTPLLGGDVTCNNGILVAKTEQYITESNPNDWRTHIAEFDYGTYKNQNNVLVEKLNIVLSANSLFEDRSTIKTGNSLTIDDVELLYYHGLESVTYNGKKVNIAYEDVNHVEIDFSSMSYDASKALSYVRKGQGAQVKVGTYNKETAQLVIRVEAEDYDATNYPNQYTEYVLQFMPTYDYADGSAFEVAPGVYNVSINRTFNAGWSTICLPFATTTSALGAGVKAQALSGASETTLSFTGTETLEANKPYLVYFPSAVNSLSFTEVTVEEQAPVAVTFGAWTFEGTYAASKLMSGLYGVAKQNGEDKILMGGTSAKIKATRAFFSTTAANVKEMGIELDGVVTAIDNVEMAGKKTFDVYSVSGALMRQGATSLNGLHSGLYIINGKKVLVK